MPFLLRSVEKQSFGGTDEEIRPLSAVHKLLTSKCNGFLPFIYVTVMAKKKHTNVSFKILRYDLVIAHYYFYSFFSYTEKELHILI